MTAIAEYDNATGQVSGDFISYELTDLVIVVPDDTQGGDFDLIPAALNSATRLVIDPSGSLVDGSWFQGLVLPNNVTGLGQVDAFDLDDISFEAEGFNGPVFRFNLGVPVVEFPEPGSFPGLAAGAAGLAVLGRKRARR